MCDARLKVSPEVSEAVYHVMSRTVNGERLFEDSDKEVLRRQLWNTADFCGIEVITQSILNNHFHLLVRVPKKAPVSDAEILRRYSILHPKVSAKKLSRIARSLEENTPKGVEWRHRQLRLMGDLSPFMKLLKQRYSIWFNKAHGRFGTLWAERYKSVLVEHHGHALETVAAYIDLNCVRAGLCTDPKDYRFCGYAEAVAGNERARSGLMGVVGMDTWEEAQAAYRTMLFSKGTCGEVGEGRIPREEFDRVLAAGGKLPLATVLRCRVRYFNDGAVLGSRIFVQTHWPAYREKTRRQEMRIGPLPSELTDWGDIFAMRTLRDAITLPAD